MHADFSFLTGKGKMLDLMSCGVHFCFKVLLSRSWQFSWKYEMKQSNTLLKHLEFPNADMIRTELVSLAGEYYLL